uniref:TBC1 domain family member 2 n=1 Tax=Astyanax mexicanus TaxID=7994 RepID=W5LAP4_ASTMX
MEGEGGCEGNPSADASGSLPPQREKHTPGSGECCSVVESPETTHTDTMGLSTGDQEKDGTPVDAPQPDCMTMGLKPIEPLSGTKLCGYLHKQGGPLRAWKYRWFTYDEKKCQLFYYRMAQDVNPLGKVELCNATFSYPLQGEEGTFHIQTPERTFILKAATWDLKMYWLQQLQLRRWQHRDQLSSDCSRSTSETLTQDGQQLLDTLFSLTSILCMCQELVWLLHKALESAQLEKRACAEFLAAEGEQERLELLRHGERCAADLRYQVERLKRENEALQRSLSERDAHVIELQSNIKLLMEKNQAKQQVIVKLSDELTECIADPQRSISSASISKQTFRQMSQELDSLKDDIEAYKTQNKFLNSEIYQLTKLWRNSSEQEKSLMVKCAYLEASNCQMESRYLGVLRKLQDTKLLNAQQRDTVRTLIEDALQENIKDVIKEFDEYGFKLIPDYEVEDMKLLSKIQALEIRSNNLLQQDIGDKSLLARWTQYLGGRSPDDLALSPELKGLLRWGIPREYRRRVWSWMVRTRTKSDRERHPDLFQQLCEKSLTTPHPASRQIQLDLHRTLTTNQHFSSPSSPALQQLHRVLLAFAWQNPEVGYCQGLNRLAALALLVLQNEEDAFWCLVTIVQSLMPQDYYTKTLLGSQADQRVFKDFMAEKLPRLVAHLEEHNVDVSLITFNWFLVVFVESLPSEILLKVWDAFFYEGTKVIFRYALALFKYKEEDILKIHDSTEIYQYLRFFTKTVTDSRKLMTIAFTELNPFPMKLLRNRRALHLQRLQAELSELEKLQKEYASEKSQRKDKDLDLNASEDDEDVWIV